MSDILSVIGILQKSCGSGFVEILENGISLVEVAPLALRWFDTLAF